jgi:hypothetical protein
MKLDAGDIESLRPIIAAVVSDVLAELRTDQAKLNGRIGYTESEAAAAIGVQRHVLRDARLRGEIAASRVGKRIVYQTTDLLKFLEGSRTR